MKKDPLVFLKHILDATELIEEFIKDYTKKRFLEDKLVQSAVIRQIEIIGEAAKNIPASFRKNYPKIPWVDIVGMRDKLIHLYFGVDLERVWLVITEDIPILSRQIQEILQRE